MGQGEERVSSLTRWGDGPNKGFLEQPLAEKNLIEEEFYISYDTELKELRHASQIMRNLPKVQIYRIYIEPRLKEYALQHLKKTA